MSYDLVGRAPPAFSECALKRHEEFYTAYNTLVKTLKNETKSFNELLEDERKWGGRLGDKGKSNLAKGSEARLISLVEEQQKNLDIQLLERVTTTFIDALWPTSKWDNNKPRKEVKEFFTREIEAVSGVISYREGRTPLQTRALESVLSRIIEAAKDQLAKDQLKHEK